MKLKNHKIIILLITVAIVWVGAENFLQTFRIYQGYCEKNGIKLTADERLVIAINHYLRQQTLTDLLEIRRAEGVSVTSDELKKIYTLIPYQSYAEFKRDNPDCCKRTWGGVEGDQFGFWERSSGVGDGMFQFSHKIRYLDVNGVSKTLISEKTYYTVNNCGHPRPRFFP